MNIARGGSADIFILTLTQDRYIFVLVQNYGCNRFPLTVHCSFLCDNFWYGRDVSSAPSNKRLQALQQPCPLHFSSRRQRLAYEGFSKKPPHICWSQNFVSQFNMQAFHVKSLSYPLKGNTWLGFEFILV